jgi:hypothetical protein
LVKPWITQIKVILAINALGIWRLARALREKKPWSRPIKAQNARIVFAILKLAPGPKNKAAGTMAAPGIEDNSLQEPIHNTGVKKPIFRSKCLLNPSGNKLTGTGCKPFPHGGVALGDE